MNDIAKRKVSVPAGVDAEALILKALESNVPVESLERLLAMRDKLKAEQAREAFFQALSGFQSKCPPVKKTQVVRDKNGSVRYAYASLDDIIRQVSPHLNEFGLSFTIKSELVSNGSSWIKATCEVHHIAGHSESSSFSVPIEKTTFMNDAQKTGSARTYAKRYAFEDALGIMTTEYDDDAQALSPIERISENQVADLECMIDEVGADLDRFLEYMRVPDLSQIALASYPDAVKALERKRRK